MITSGNEIYRQAKMLMYEKPSSTIYDSYAIDHINRAIRDCYEDNNMERMFNDKPPLLECPRLSTLDDEVELEDLYATQIVPLFVAAYFLIDDDLEKYQIYITDAKNELIIHKKVVSQEKIDELTTIAQSQSN